MGLREPAALERVENLTVSYRSRLAVDAAACEASAASQRRMASRGGRREARAILILAQASIVVSRGFAAAKSSGPWGALRAPVRA